MLAVEIAAARTERIKRISRKNAATAVFKEH